MSITSSPSPAGSQPIDRSLTYPGGQTGFLLIHGLGGTPVELRFVAQGLARAGYTVHCCQLAGHCQTEEELLQSSWREWYRSVEAAHDRLRRECSTVIAGGLSMGGLLALELARRRPEGVDGLAVYAPSLFLDGWAVPRLSRYLLGIPRPIGKWRSRITLREREPYGLKDERVRAFVLNHMQSGDASTAGVFSTPLHAISEFNAFVAQLKPALGKIETPTLIIHPREDDMASLRNAHYLQRRLGGLVDLVVLDDSYHMVTLDRQRHIVVDRTLAFTEALVRRKREETARVAMLQSSAAG